MNRETFKTQLSELFPGEKISIVWFDEANEAEIIINRKLSRLELGHMFSLGSKSIKGLDAGLFITFDLNNALLNFSNDTIINHLK